MDHTLILWHNTSLYRYHYQEHFGTLSFSFTYAYRQYKVRQSLDNEQEYYWS